MTSSFFLSFLWVCLQSLCVLSSSNEFQQVVEFQWYSKLVECDSQLKACLITTSPTDIAIFDEETIYLSESISVSSEPIKSMRILRHQQKTFLLIESEQTELILYALEEMESAEQEQQEDGPSNGMNKQEKNSQDFDTFGERNNGKDKYETDNNPKSEQLGNPQSQLEQQQDQEQKQSPKDKRNHIRKNWWQKWRGWLKDKKRSFRGKVLNMFSQNPPKDEFFKHPNIELVAGSAVVSFDKDNTVVVRAIDSGSIQFKEQPLFWIEWRFKLSEQSNVCVIQAVEVIAEKQIIVINDSCGKLWIGNLHFYPPFTFSNNVHSVSLVEYTNIIPGLDNNHIDDQILERLYIDDLNSQIILAFSSRLRNCLEIDTVDFDFAKSPMTQFPKAFRRIWENTQLSSVKVSHDKAELFIEGGLILIHNFEKSKLQSEPSFEYSEQMISPNLRVVAAIQSTISTKTHKIGAFFASADSQFHNKNFKQDLNIFNSSNPHTHKNHKKFHQKFSKLSFFVLTCSDSEETQADELTPYSSSLKESSQYFFLDSMDCMSKACESILEENSGICKETQPKQLKLIRISQRQFFGDDPKFLGVIIIAIVSAIILSQEELFGRYALQRTQQQSADRICEMKSNLNSQNENQNPAAQNLPKERSTKEAREAMRAKFNQKFKLATYQKTISIDNSFQLPSKDFSVSASPNSYGLQSSPDQIQSESTQQPLSSLNVKRSHSSSMSPLLGLEEQYFEQQLQEQMEYTQDSSHGSSDREEQQWAIMSDLDWEKTSSYSSESYEITVRKIRCLSPPNATFDIHNFSRISQDFFNESTATTASTTPLLRPSQSESVTDNTKNNDNTLALLNLFQNQQ